MRSSSKKPFWRFLPLLAGILISAAALGAGLLYGELNRKKKDLLDYLQSHPETTAIAAYTFDANGELVDDGASLFHNADTPFVMASTMKTVVLAAYADAVVAGALDPAERVAVREIERYYLPFTDGGAHKNGLARLGLGADEAGFAVDPGAAITLDDVARIMIHDSGNAEMDYLLSRLGSERMAAVMAKGGLAHHTPIRPVLEATLVMFNQEHAASPRTPEERVRLYTENEDWRAAQIAYIRSGQVQTSLEDQAAVMEQMGARGTAREYAQVLARVASGRFISAEVSQRMQQMLESVPTDAPLRLLFYRRLGAKEGVVPGVLNLASYMTPKTGPLAGKSRVVVLLINGLPGGPWMSSMQYVSHFLVQADLARGAGGWDTWTDLE